MVNYLEKNEMMKNNAQKLPQMMNIYLHQNWQKSHHYFYYFSNQWLHCSKRLHTGRKSSVLNRQAPRWFLVAPTYFHHKLIPREWHEVIYVEWCEWRWYNDIICSSNVQAVVVYCVGRFWWTHILKQKMCNCFISRQDPSVIHICLGGQDKILLVSTSFIVVG